MSFPGFPRFPRVGLKHMLRTKLKLKKRKEASIDNQFATAEITYDEFDIVGEMYVITAEDLWFMPPGILEIGHARGWFYPEYEVTDPETGLPIKIRVEPLDIIGWDDDEWEVMEVMDHKIQGITILIEARCRKRTF